MIDCFLLIYNVNKNKSDFDKCHMSHSTCIFQRQIKNFMRERVCYMEAEREERDLKQSKVQKDVNISDKKSETGNVSGME